MGLWGEAKSEGYRKREQKALKKSGAAPVVRLLARGLQEVRDFEARGWTMTGQDMSEAGAWVKQFFMEAPRELVEQLVNQKR